MFQLQIMFYFAKSSVFVKILDEKGKKPQTNNVLFHLRFFSFLTLQFVNMLRFFPLFEQKLYMLI